MNFVYFALIGLVAGWLAGKIFKGGGFGLIGNLVVGILGAIVGGWLLGGLFSFLGALLGSLVTAVLGAGILLWVVSLFKK